jgi:hypothetical protein
MNMLYEGLKQNSTIVLVPSTAVDSMQLGGLAGVTSMAMELNKGRAGRASTRTPAPLNAENAND